MINFDHFERCEMISGWKQTVRKQRKQITKTIITLVTISEDSTMAYPMARCDANELALSLDPFWIRSIAFYRSNYIHILHFQIEICAKEEHGWVRTRQQQWNEWPCPKVISLAKISYTITINVEKYYNIINLLWSNTSFISISRR